MNGTTGFLPVRTRRIPQDWLVERNRVTEELYQHPYDLSLYLDRAKAYRKLGYHDLAAGDAYRALLLIDEVREDSGEWHKEAVEAMKEHYTGDEAIIEEWIQTIVEENTLKSYQILAASLSKCGCLKTALDFCNRGLTAAPEDPELLKERERIIIRGKRLHRRDSQPKKAESSRGDQGDAPLDPNTLPDQGFARREVYPWNTHEPNRFSSTSIDFLNGELTIAAPKLCVRATDLPYLDETASIQPALDRPSRKQLGLFALSDIAPGETVLRETSPLTVNNRLHASLCDYCSALLPDMTASPDSAQQIATCSDCDDTFFCDEECLEAAISTYHPAICGLDLESVGKEAVSTDRRGAPQTLYTLLLARAFAMSLTQEIHPLDLKQVKYIWGDFNPIEIQPSPSPTLLSGHPQTTAEQDSEEETIYDTHALTHLLPFSFQHAIAEPLHILEKMDINPFTTLESLSDPYIHQTLLSKFRATASARLSKVDGSPEVAAVHPLWCLANHSCDPNVRWEWGGEITFSARQERVQWAGEGKERKEARIRQGEEILSHYCDVELPVRERREWAVGSLGGVCVCERCVWEEKQAMAIESEDIERKKHVEADGQKT